MCRDRDQHDVSVAFTSAFVVCADTQQTCVFTIRTTVWLYAATGKSGDGRQVCFQFFNDVQVTLCLLFWCKRVHFAPVRPAQRNHFRSSIQLHRTATQRDHAGIQAQVFIFQRLDITHHQGFAVMAVEISMGQVV
ncbi:hypothetical protein D3C86_1301780 [compost metagenome]